MRWRVAGGGNGRNEWFGSVDIPEFKSQKLGCSLEVSDCSGMWFWGATDYSIGD